MRSAQLFSPLLCLGESLIHVFLESTQLKLSLFFLALSDGLSALDLLGAGGSPPLSPGPLDWGLEFDPFEAGGAGRMGRDIWPFWLDWLLDWLWWLMLLVVRWG